MTKTELKTRAMSTILKIIGLILIWAVILYAAFSTHIICGIFALGMMLFLTGTILSFVEPD